MENLYHGDKVYVRLTDGEKASQPQEKQILDAKAPAKAIIELNKESLTAGDTLTAKVTHIDNESGVDLAQSKWILNQTASEIGTDAGNYTGTFSSNEETITLDSKTTGEYYLHILTVDKGGNKTETISNKITIGSITGTVQQKGETTWSSGKASIELEATESQYTIEYKINSGNWTNYSGAIGNLNYGDKITARLTNGTVTGPETTIEIKDENNPVVIVTPGGTTTNSVTVSVSASDNESGMADNVTYTYYIKKTSEGDGSYNSPNGATNISQTNYTFTNLDQGTSYDVKVEAKADKAGNIGTGSLPNQTTATIGGASEGLVEGNIVAGPVTWKNEKASTTLTTSTGLQIQYQINDTAEGSWQTISNGGTVGNLNHGDTVFARLYDGKNHGDYASVNILDGTPPTVQISVGEITKNSIAVSVTANDGQSGLATSNTYKYYLNSELKQTTTETSYTFEGLTAGTSYEIKVEAYDKANNKGTDTENVKTAGVPTDGSFSEEEGVNTPNIGNNMQLVEFDDETDTWVPDETKSAYSYKDTSKEGANTSEWANAKVTIDGIDSYFVWIPRYAYKIIGENNIDIKFIKGTGKETVDGTPCKYASENPTANDYIVHPAFTDEEENGGWDMQIAGIWIGKYEASLANKTDGTNIVPSSSNANILLKNNTDKTIVTKPGYSSWRYIRIGNMYDNAKYYSTDLESHMLKNSEWGAIAYLTESKYGRNGTEIGFSDDGYITGGGENNAYATTNQDQSTTGNVYGIYDMRGGAYEYVASYYTGGNSTYLNNGSSFTNTKTSDKYATAYTGDDVSTSYKYGDATYETSGWHTDVAYFVSSNNPFFTRGGNYTLLASRAGVFYFNSWDGSASNDYSYRLALVV